MTAANERALEIVRKIGIDRVPHAIRAKVQALLDEGAHGSDTWTIEMTEIDMDMLDEAETEFDREHLRPRR